MQHNQKIIVFPLIKSSWFSAIEKEDLGMHHLNSTLRRHSVSSLFSSFRNRAGIYPPRSHPAIQLWGGGNIQIRTVESSYGTIGLGASILQALFFFSSLYSCLLFLDDRCHPFLKFYAWNICMPHAFNSSTNWAWISSNFVTNWSWMNVLNISFILIEV